MIREGEESQEYSLKITSDQNFREAWMCIWIIHVIDSRSSCYYDFKKCLNSQTWQNVMNNQNHPWVMKIQPKTEKMNLTSYERIFILDHEETSHIRFWDVFHEFDRKYVFTIHDEKVCLMRFDERKVRILVKKIFYVL